MVPIEDDAEKAGRICSSGLGRRDLMKLGAGVVLSTLESRRATAQEAEGGAAKSRGSDSQLEGVVRSGPGYKNDAGRLYGNGPMDDTSRRLASFATSFSESQLTEANLPGIGTYVIDSLAAAMAGFETEQGRIGTRIGRVIQSSMKSTIFGYGVVTAPQIAALTNAVMIRHKDFNDMGGGHSSVMFPGILAIGESLHSTGAQVLTAMALAVEVAVGLQKAEAPVKGQGVRWDTKYLGVSTALATGKLMGLNEDRLANALSMALVPHIPLEASHVGALSHYKSMHGAIATHDGVFAAMMAREGMTGPSQPFEGRGGLWDCVTGPYKDLRLPTMPNGQLAMANMKFKRFPTDGDHLSLLSDGIPAVREWTKVEDIASIDFEIPWSHWQENADPPKWDPRNSETADHSLPYAMAVALISGEEYLSDYTPKRYLEDAAVRQLMEKITCRGNSEYDFDRARITVRKKTGEEFVKDVFEYKNPTHDETVAKFKRVCAYTSVKDEQRDRILSTWSSLQNIRDIADAIRDLAHYGNPMPL